MIKTMKVEDFFSKKRLYCNYNKGAFNFVFELVE